ncbi:MAG: glycosyltransferase family 8 protein [Faecousia sp.]
MPTINILYSGDKGIERGLVMSVLSIARLTGRQLHIYVLTMRYSAQDKEYLPVSERCIDRVRSIAQEATPGSTVTLLDGSAHFRQDPPEKNLGTRFTPGCMLRLFADLEDLPDKLLYLDSDVLCRDGAGFESLYDTDVADWEYAAVLDHYGSWFFRQHLFRRDYVNSGVLLLNMDRIRQTGLFEKCRELCRTKKMFMPDQSALNRLAQRKKLLPGKYNEQRRLHRDTVLQHFTTSFRVFPVIRYVTVKPWEQEKVHKVLKLKEYDDLFRDYNNRTADLF